MITDGPPAPPAPPDPAEATDRGPRIGGIEVHELSLVEAVPLRAAWNELLVRAVEPDVLHGPDVLIPALETFAPDARLLVAHRGEGGIRRLVAVVALWTPRLGFGLSPRLPTVFSNEYAPLGTPLVDADRPEEIIAALIAAITRTAGGVVFRHLPLEGPFAAALGRVAATADHRITVVESHLRACLHGGTDGTTFLDHHIGRKRRREWRRQWRRLAETGPVRTSVARGVEARSAFADFLVLEASGWKGRRRTAMVQNAGVMRFAERVVDGLAETGHVVVDRIDRDGQPLAMLVSFGAEGHWVSWKTAYDEAFAAYSPGAQVLLRATIRALDAGELVEIDSLAVEDHPLMNHVWPDRRRIGTVVVGFPAPRRPPLAVRIATAELRLYLAVRRLARRLRERFAP